MKILALDLGTSMGFACLDTATGECAAGSVNLEKRGKLKQFKKTRDVRHFDPRMAAFIVMLRELDREYCPDRYAFEDVKFASSQAQAHLWASFRGVLWAFVITLPRRGVHITSLNTGTLKKVSSGAGNATKEMMAAALVRKFPPFQLGTAPGTVCVNGQILGDDAVDAIHLALWAQK